MAESPGGWLRAPGVGASSEKLDEMFVQVRCLNYTHGHSAAQSGFIHLGLNITDLFSCLGKKGQGYLQQRQGIFLML